MPETRFEILDGEVEYVPPSDEPHGVRQSKIGGLLEVYVVDGYRCAADMLTRAAVRSDVAPDASVYPAERDPRTGGRKLEDLAFEIVGSERLSHAAKKARFLVKRGVRRVFAVDVKGRRVLEWSMKARAWEALPDDGEIEDRAFVLPLPLRPLIDASAIDDAVARALIAKNNPVLREENERAEERGKQKGFVAGEIKGRAEGRIEGKIEALLVFFERKKIPVSKEVEARLRAAAANNAGQVHRWIAQAYDGARPEDLLK
jgi:Uma2 family endonuclease